MTETSSHAVFHLSGRRSKAEKIRVLLEPWIRGRRGLRLLEVGTGAGVIAHLFARHSQIATVDAIDVRDQRVMRDGYQFHLYDGDRFPFANASFDILISNHVVEHVGDRVAQLRHLREMRRVLADAGVGYLATPSRWQPMEPHFRLLGLGWLPRAWRSPYVRLAQRGRQYDCDPFSHREIEAAMSAVDLPFRNQNAKALMLIHAMENRTGMWAQVSSWLPLGVLERFYRFSPTMIYLVGAVDGVDPDVG